MSKINLQDGYDLGYSYCKVCEDWSTVSHDHKINLQSLTAEELVAMLPVCPQCNKHGVIAEIENRVMCMSCWKALKAYAHTVYHS